MKNYNSIETRVIEIISRSLAIDPSTIASDSKFACDLHIDSLSFAEMLMSIEEEFWVHISAKDIEKMKTIEDLVNSLFARSSYSHNELFYEDEILLPLYLVDLRSSIPLTRDEEHLIAQKISQGSLEARNKLVFANLKFVVRVAKDYRNREVSLMDLISYGNLGLIDAAERFKPINNKFISYAVWYVRAAILEYRFRDPYVVRIPTTRLYLNWQIQQFSKALQQAELKYPDLACLADQMGVSVAVIENAMIMTLPAKSLYSWVNPDAQYTLIDLLADTTVPSPDFHVNRESCNRLIHKAVGSLPEIEQEVIRSHFGLDGHEPLTIKDIASRLKISPQRVSQIKKRALMILQDSCYKMDL